MQNKDNAAGQGVDGESQPTLGTSDVKIIAASLQGSLRYKSTKHAFVPFIARLAHPK